MPGYWNAHSDRDFDDQDREQEPELPACMIGPSEPCRGIQLMESRYREEIAGLKATLALLSADVAAAEKWAAEYQRNHGPFKREPREPAFIIVF
jgi:hypothetical protein